MFMFVLSLIYSPETLYLLGRTHVLVIRGLDEDVHEEILRYEFSKHAPIKVLANYFWPRELRTFCICSW